MRTPWLIGLTAALLIGGLPVAVAFGTSNDTPQNQRSSAPVAQGTSGPDEDKTNGATEKADKGGGRDGLGPPPWARGQKPRGREDKAWKDAWQQLTPAQRERRMTALAKDHATGMRKWVRCVAAAGEDATKRSACRKPTPPGLAKRLG